MRKNFFEGRKNILKKVGCLALAAVIAGTGLVTYQNTLKSDIPELATFVDPEVAETQQDEVPLASGTKTTRKVTKKTTTKKTKMAKKATKSSTTTKKTTKQTNKTKSSKTQKVKTNTKIDTTVKTSTKKNSNVKTTQTQVVTTVTTTTQTFAVSSSSSAAAAATQTAQTSEAKSGTYSVKSVAPVCDARVLNAYEKMGFKVIVNPSVSYSGCFDAAKRTITLRKLDSTVYHELGHYLEFIGGTSAVKQLINNAYNTEKSLYTASNKAYVLQNSSEYFAESFKNYCENPGALCQSRPKTYEAIVQALNNVTDARVNSIISVYSSVWK